VKVLNPFAFRAGEILDPRRVNANLDELAEASRGGHDRRFTRWTETHDLTGLADTDNAATRSIPIFTAASRTAELIGIRVVIYSASGAVWTLGSTDYSDFRSFPTTTAGATTRAVATYEGPRFQVDSTRKMLVLSADVANTISAGHVELIYQSDRHAQGTTATAYAPSLRFSDTTLDTETILTGELAAVATAVAGDVAANFQIRGERFTVYGATARVFRLLASGRRVIAIGCYGVGASGTTNILLQDETPANIQSVNMGVATTGVGVMQAITPQAQAGTSPNAPAKDWLLTITPSATATVTSAVIIWDR